MSDPTATPAESTDDAEKLAQAVLAAAVRAKDYAGTRAWPQAMVQVLTIAEHETDMDAPGFGTSWRLSSYTVDRALPDGTDEEKRAHAIAWLRRHAEGLRTILRTMGLRPHLSKVSENGNYGVRAVISDPNGGHLVTIEAHVDDALTCEMEPTGEVEEVPAVPATSRPVMRKVCPPSIFQTVADDLADPDPDPPGSPEALADYHGGEGF